MGCTKQRSEQIQALAAGELGEPRLSELLDHIEECSRCSEEMELVAYLVTGLPREVRPGATRPRVSFLPWVGLAAVAALVLVAVGLSVVLSGDGAPSRETLVALAELETLPATGGVLRSGEDPVTSPGIDAYTAGDDARAIELLGRALADDPEQRVTRFYLAMSLIRAGNLEESLPHLEELTRTAEGLLRERSLWYLANVHLARGEVEPARAVLESLLHLEGDYEMNARDKLSALDGNQP